MALRDLKSIYTYSDYRIYLRDYFDVRRKSESSFSHREMAKELGFSSPNYIKLVMDGKRNLGLRSINRLVQGLGFKLREREYFSNLVFFGQAKTPVEKNYFLGQLIASRPSAKKGAITPKEYRYYNEWYHCVVRELVVREKPPVDFGRIARKIRPNVTPSQVEKSVKLLLELGLIKKKKGGAYIQSSRLIATDREVTSLGIRNYHTKMIELGKKCLDTVKREKREVSSLTLCISYACRERIKRRVQAFESEILHMAHDDKNTSKVHQLNFQFFPLTEEEE